MSKGVSRAVTVKHTVSEPLTKCDGCEYNNATLSRGTTEDVVACRAPSMLNYLVCPVG